MKGRGCHIIGMACVLVAQSLSAIEVHDMLTLRFSNEGKFKIVQFTDIHFAEGHPEASVEQAKTNSVLCKCDAVVAMMGRLLDEEKPALVVFTGDNVTTREKPLEAWRTLVAPVLDRKIPWAVIMGNHDFEYTGVRQHDLMAFLEALPYSLSQCGPPELGGGGNYMLPIMAHDSPEKKAALYCMDSGDYASKRLSDGYAWFTFPQIKWFRNQAQAMTDANKGQPLPSLAFFHIPFPEYQDALATEKVIGEKREKVSCPKLNSGMFTAMLESGSVLGTFVGHDHNNDYTASYHGICLAFGRKTGDFSYHGLPVGGARVIELEEGCRRFTTWIHTAPGTLESRVSFPDDFQPSPLAK